MDAAATNLIADLFAVYLASCLFAVIASVQTNVLFARGRTRAVAVVGVVGFVLYAAIAIAASRAWGPFGIALAHALTGAANVVLFAWLVRATLRVDGPPASGPQARP
jgi:peptidoglycan biosynthesis protein MviN/MurJ (putative lipid II flippase)